MSNKQVKLQHVADASVLYHYTKSKGVNGILHSNCFWATKSDFLNDPKEFSYIETIIREVCCELIEEKSLCDMFLEDVLEEIFSAAAAGARNISCCPFLIAETALPCGLNLGMKPAITSALTASG